MPARIQRRRTKGWRKPDNCVIVTRPSRFGNPFRITAAMDVLGLSEAEARKAAVTAFGPWLAGSRAEWESDDADRKRERILANLHLLPGKDLACPCPEDEACHADTLIEWAADPALDARIARARTLVDWQRTRRGEERMYPGEQRQYEASPVGGHWQIGIYRDRGLLNDTDPTWADVAAAHNFYYGCSEDSPHRLHVGEDGRAYRITATP